MLPAVWTLWNFVILHNICKFEWNTLNVSTLFLIFDNVYMETSLIVKHGIWRDIPVILYWNDELVCCDLAKCRRNTRHIEFIRFCHKRQKKPTKNPILQPKQNSFIEKYIRYSLKEELRYDKMSRSELIFLKKKRGSTFYFRR